MTLIGYLKVSRLPLLLIGLLGPLACLNWIGALWTEPFKSFLLILTIFSANWAWNLYNELHDQEVDAINKPWKAFPSRQVDECNVIVMFLVLLLASLILNVLLIGFFGVFYSVAFLAHVTAFIYNGWRKDLLGNICEVTTIGLAVFIVMYPQNMLFPLALAIFWFGNALICQYQDLEAEKVAKVLTAPQQLGCFGTALVSLASLFLACGLLCHIYLMSGYYPILVFVVTCVANMVCSVSILCFTEHADWVIENMARRLGRLLLIIGFLSMMF